MSDRLWIVVGALLAVGGLVASAVTTRPRPRSWREMLYVALPLAGAVALIVVAWGRV
ncbi:MAG TPA: hypothetical protein VFY15_00225 [Acidimicrobiia bacterium]|nr:hypothetical protein [Acidimicrobiia bacterium]